MIESKFRLQESYQQLRPFAVIVGACLLAPQKYSCRSEMWGPGAAWLGCSGFFVKPRARLLLLNMLIFARYILAGIFSH
jgi:hypothetical protein